jgi:hypothetical protein
MRFGLADYSAAYCGIWPIKCRQGSKMNKSNLLVLEEFDIGLISL